MNGVGSTMRGLTVLGAFGLALVASGCAHVNQDELDSRIEGLREEIREGDQQNSEEVDQLASRVDQLEGLTGELEQDLEALRNDFDMTVERLETALRFSAPVHFGFDESDVREQDQELLDRFAAVVNRYYPESDITVEGFTDPAGGEAYNLDLGQRRAEAVKSYLTQNASVTGERVRTVSYGESVDRLIKPDAAGPGQTGIENRRVVLVVDYRPTGASVAEMPESGGGR